jgi:transcriptional regulator with XRE-family HTH domain
LVGQNAVEEFDPAKLRAARVAAGLSQEKLAARMRVPRISVVRWEGGHRRPYAGTLAALAEALGLAPDALTTRREQEPPSLAQLRIAAGLTQQAAATRSELVRTRYSAIERGEFATVSDATVEAIAGALGVTPALVRTAHAQSRAARLRHA